MGKNVNQQNTSEWLGLQKMLIPNIAVLGCVYWGKNLVRNFHQLGALQLVCDTTEQGRATATAVPGCDILSDPRKGLVFVGSGSRLSLPNHLPSQPKEYLSKGLLKFCTETT